MGKFLCYLNVIDVVDRSELMQVKVEVEAHGIDAACTEAEKKLRTVIYSSYDFFCSEVRSLPDHIPPPPLAKGSGRW